MAHAKPSCRSLPPATQQCYISDTVTCFECCTMQHPAQRARSQASAESFGSRGDGSVIHRGEHIERNVKTANLCADLQRFNPVSSQRAKSCLSTACKDSTSTRATGLTRPPQQGCTRGWVLAPQMLLLQTSGSLHLPCCMASNICNPAKYHQCAQRRWLQRPLLGLPPLQTASGRCSFSPSVPEA